MSRKFICLISFVLVLGLARASIVKAGLDNDPNLLGWWKFDGDANDSSGRGHLPGILRGATAPGFATGKIGQAIQLNGTDQWVEIPVHADFADVNNHGTFALWLYGPGFPPGYTVTRQLISKGGSGDMGAWRRGLRTDTAPFYFRQLQFRGREGGNRNALQAKTVLPLNLNDPNVWTHVAVTYDINISGNNQKIYINGILDAQNHGYDPLNSHYGLGANGWGIGADIYDGRWSWMGRIDDVRIYSRALTAAEIKKLSGIKEATNPTPADTSKVNTKNVLLQWYPGSNVADLNGHQVYFGDNFDDVDAGAGSVDKGLSTDPNCPVSGLVPGTTYYWKSIEINGVSQWPGPIWRFTVATGKAYNPDPPDGRIYVGRSRTLRWTAGTGATSHHIYFGTNQTDVTNGTGGTDKGTRTEPNYTPGTLMYDTTYYWRIAEVNGLNGDVWRFVTTASADPSLIVWLQMDGDYLDASGYENNAWPAHDTNIVTVTSRPYAVGGTTGVVNLSNVSDFDECVVIPYKPMLDITNAVTVACWAYSREAESQQDKFLSKGGTGVSYGFCLNNTANRYVDWRMNGSLLSTTSFPVNEWTHVVITFDLNAGVNNQKMYINGTLNNQNTSTTALSTSLSPVVIGGFDTSGTTWQGMFDDVRIYNRALTAAEIKALYEANEPPRKKE
jgi:hypothetical protein